jgi:hypothetical protein
MTALNLGGSLFGGAAHRPPSARLVLTGKLVSTTPLDGADLIPE